MVQNCVVYGCSNLNKKGSTISFHKFPADPETYEKWVRNISRKSEKGKIWHPSKYSTVCSEHFVASDFHFKSSTEERSRLNSSAVPTIFNSYPSYKQPKLNKARPALKRIFETTCPSSASESVKSKVARISEDHKYASETDPQMELLKTKERLTKVLKEKKILVQTVNRQKEKISNLLHKVKDLNLLQKQHLDLLKLNFGENTLTLIENELSALNKDPHGLRYSDTLKSFAVTLHFYSAQAYEYLRKFLHLPHTSTIRKWASSINCEPGYLSEVFSYLKLKLEKDGNMKDVSLMFDGMAIKKECVYDAKLGQYCGSVNYGHLQSGCADSLATEILVLLVVGLRGHWKQPIGYFLIDHITSEMQGQLVKDAIAMLSQIGFIVHSVVCDGSYTNQSTASLLGCVIQKDMQNTFPNPLLPDKLVYFMFDVCHLLKCVRNCLADLKIIKHNSLPIRWEYLVELNKIQMEDNLHLVNKLKAKHINFQRHKMNVKIAAQTLSSSVADAIDFLREDMKLPQFQGSEATVEFIRMFDKLFDICNSHYPFGKGYKKPLNKYNLRYNQNFFKTATDCSVIN